MALILSKSFSPNEIPSGGTSVMTLTINNDAGPVGVAFIDTFPAGMSIAATPNVITSGFTAPPAIVANPGDGFLNVPPGLVAATTIATISVNVTSTATGINSFMIGDVASNNATLTVTEATPLTTVKTFSPPSIQKGGTSVLTITITNPNPSPVTSVLFTDTYPLGLVNKTPANIINTFGGIITSPDGGNVLNLSGGTIGANSSASVSVEVTSDTASEYLNFTSVISSSIGSSAGADATLTVTQSRGRGRKNPVIFCQANVVIGGILYELDKAASAHRGACIYKVSPLAGKPSKEQGESNSKRIRMADSADVKPRLGQVSRDNNVSEGSESRHRDNEGHNRGR